MCFAHSRRRKWFGYTPKPNSARGRFCGGARLRSRLRAACAGQLLQPGLLLLRLLGQHRVVLGILQGLLHCLQSVWITTLAVEREREAKSGARFFWPVLQRFFKALLCLGV